MNEKLICLLNASIGHLRCVIELGGFNSEREVIEHIEELKGVRKLLEHGLACPSQEEQSRGVSERDRDSEMCCLNQVLQDIRVELVRATEVFRSASSVATKSDLEKLENKIMSAIGDWVTTNGPKLDRIQTGLDTVQDLVEKLQNTSGAITPEDQALLDQIEKKIDAIASDADSVPAPPVPPPA